MDNVDKKGVNLGFSFLFNQSGFSIIQSLIDYSPQSTYLEAFWVSILNTLLVAVIGCFIATFLGFFIGIARLSTNLLIRRSAGYYVETLRNIPLLLQIFFWYHAVLKPLPGPRSVHQNGEEIYFSITNNGILFAKPILNNNALILLSLSVLFFIVAVWLRKREIIQKIIAAKINHRKSNALFITSVVCLILIFVFQTISLEPSQMGRFRPEIGLGINVIPELVAIVLSLSFYGAAFIAENVRSGIQSVDKGQLEASKSLGLSNKLTLKKIIIPQAMRVIIPPLTSQYLNITKNSSLATAIAYPDLMAVFAGTALNQTGQALEVMGMTLLVYLFFSSLTALVMNWYNKKHQLYEKNSKLSKN